MIIHGARDAETVLHVAAGRAVLLLSAPGAALFAGIGWWRALIGDARAAHPGPWQEALDCADAAALALAALRVGQRGLILWPDAPGRAAVAAIARDCGALLLDGAPPCLDLAGHPAPDRLATWLSGAAAGGRL
ncbi:MAG: hypothetical protein KGL12_00540 [Rhodospirillales bacterium]|nr:hypothetical protein [Rhodospirillales bacterium]